jgi:two-component system, LuxR family, sensor kinase FixL
MGMPDRSDRVFAPDFAAMRGFPAASQANLAMLAAGYLAVYVFLDWASSMNALQGLAITPWNPQGGLSLALLLVYGVRLAPLLILSALIGDVIVRQLPAPFYAATLAALAPAIGYGALAWILKRRFAVDLALRSVRDVALLLAGGLVATAFVALSTASIYVGFRALPATSFIDAALRYWIGDYIGIVVLTPFLLRLPQVGRRIARPAETVAQAALLFAAWWAVFQFEFTDEFKFFFLFFVPVTWISLRHGLTGAAIACIAVQVGLIYSTTVTGKDARTVIEMQLLMLTLAIASQFTGIVVDERRAEAAARFALRDQLSHVGRITISGEIASGVAHELNQPLAAVVNYVHAALIDNRAANMPAETVSVLEKAEAQALRAGETLRRLRDFLRRGEMHLSTLSLGDAVADAAGLVHPSADRAGVALAIGPMPDGLRVLADRVHLTQILVNLLSNAVEALQSSAAPVRRIEVSAAEAAGGWVEVAVADTGPGVPPEHRERIFDSFYTTKAAGMGLGLAISRSLVEAQGGRLWYLAPAAGRMASFHFTLPAAAGEHP